MVLVLHLKQRGQYPRWMDSICLLEQQTLPIAMIQCRWIYVDLRKRFGILLYHTWNTHCIMHTNTKRNLAYPTMRL